MSTRHCRAMEICGCEDSKGTGHCSVAYHVNMAKEFEVQQEFLGSSDYPRTALEDPVHWRY